MKQIIVTLGLVLLGLFIFNTVIMGPDAGSLKSGADGVATTTMEKLSDEFK